MTETPSAGGAVRGLKVIDLARVLGGPYCTQILSDHGATVIKVEPPQGDETRAWGPPFKDGLSAYFSGVNRNKRSVGLDLGQAAGRAVLLRLLGDADVPVENFKTGTLEKWGIGYQAVLGPRFPRLVHCRITGFGADGPFGGFPGYDAVAQALSGLMSVNGTPESGPVRVGVPVVDLCAGMNAAIGILMALAERERSGAGQSLEVALYDTGIALLHPHAPNFFMSGKAPTITGDAHPNVAPYDQYETRTRTMFVGVGNERQFRRLCEELGRPELADDARFGTNADRLTNRGALDDALRPLFGREDAEGLSARLLARGVPAGAVQPVPEVFAHPHTRHREMVVERDGYRGTGIPIKLGRTPGRVRATPPAYGEGNRAVLAKAGYGEAEIDALVRDGVVLDAPRKAG